MTREEAKIFLLQLHTDKQLNKSEHEALRIAVKTLEQEPCREADDYENEISDLYNHLDIVEYDKERLREEVTTLEEKLQGLSAEPCEDAISRRGAIKKFTYNHKGERIPDYDCDNFPIQIDVKTVKEILRDLPPVTQKPKAGHWISLKTGKPSYIKDGMAIESVKCSECDEWLTASDEYACNGNYCPNCGAKMQEVQE